MLYRAVSDAESQQIARTGTFELGRAAQGKYFWDRPEHAVEFAQRIQDPFVVRATYLTQAAAQFVVLTFDAIGTGRFASEEQMNQGLLEIVRYED